MSNTIIGADATGHPVAVNLDTLGQTTTAAEVNAVLRKAGVASPTALERELCRVNTHGGRMVDLAIADGLRRRSLNSEALIPFDARIPCERDMPIETRAARIIAGLVERVEVVASCDMRTNTTAFVFPIVCRAAGQELTRSVERELAADRATITRRVEVAHRKNPKSPAPYKPSLYDRLAMARGRGPR